MSFDIKNNNTAIGYNTLGMVTNANLLGNTAAEPVLTKQEKMEAIIAKKKLKVKLNEKGLIVKKADMNFE